MERHWSERQWRPCLTTDPDARLFRKSRGTGAVLCFMGHALMENRSGLVVDAELTRATGTAERLAALAMLAGVARESGRRITIGADKGYDTADFVMEVRELNAVPHVTQNTAGRRSAIDRRTNRHPGLCRQPAHPQTHRGGLRLDEVLRRPPEDQVPRPASRPLRLHSRRRSLHLIRLPKLIAA